MAALPFVVLPLASANAAVPTDTMVEGAKLCTRHLPRYEREYAIPTHLLSAIASTESGRYHQGLKMNLPWPWAINAAGKGYYYESKEQAIAAVKKLRARGIRSIDVGCMQVNLNQHPDAFASLDQAFEPQTNIAYAARFLHTLYEDGGTWKKAATYYHSRTPSLGYEYVSSVYNSWYQIIDKLRAARLHVPESSVMAMNELKSSRSTKPAVRPSTQVTTRVTPNVIRLASNTPTVAQATKQKTASNASKALPEQTGRTVAAYQRPRMNSIQVSSAPREDASPERTRSIIVIRQDNTPPETIPVVKMANTTPLQTPIPEAAAALAPSAAPSAQVLSLAMSSAATTNLAVNPQSGAVSNMSSIANAPAANITLASNRRPVMATVGRKAGPSFIFND